MMTEEESKRLDELNDILFMEEDGGRGLTPDEAFEHVQLTEKMIEDFKKKGKW